MKTCLRAVGLALLASWMGCADFSEAEQEFCERNPDRCLEAIQLDVALPSVYASCVNVQILRPPGMEVLEERWLPRTSDTVEAVIHRRGLPEAVVLAARPYLNGNCQGGEMAQIPNGPVEAVPASFVKDKVTAAVLQLRPGQDADGDRYVSAADGGADCADASPEVHPLAFEGCSDRIDRNCDGRKGCELPSCAPNACAGAPESLALTLQASSVTAGTCTSATVQARDANGADIPLYSSAQVRLQASPPGSIAFYSDAACTTPITSVTLGPAVTRETFYFRGQAVGSATISADATGLAQGSEAVQIVPGSGNQLAVLSPPRTVAAGVCSGVVQFQSQDARGNSAPVAAATAVALAASPSTGFRFYSDAGCTAEVTSANLATGTSTSSFYFRGTRAGTITITLTAAGFIGSAQNETINPAAPSVLAFSPPSLTMAAGICTQAMLVTQDVYGNASPVTVSQAITFSASPAAGFTFSASSSCSSPVTQLNLPAGQSSMLLYARGTVAGIVTVTASRTGFTTGTLNVMVNPAAPTQLAFQTAPQTVEAGSCSGSTTVQVRDTFGNPAPVSASTQINLSGSSTNITFYSNATCTTATSSITAAPGQSSVSFYFRDATAETVTLSASSNGLATATQTQTITPRTPTALAFTTAPQSVAQGACSVIAVVETRAGGSPAPVTTSTAVMLGASPSTNFTFYSNSTCTTVVNSVTIPVGQSSAPFYFRGTNAGSVTITASSTGLTSATQSATITRVPTKLQFTSPPFNTEAGSCSSAATIESSDANDNPAPVATNTTVNLSQSGNPSDAQFRFYSDAGCTTVVTSVTLLAGQSEVNFYYRGLQVRSVTLTAAATGLTSASQVHTITGAGVAPESAD